MPPKATNKISIYQEYFTATEKYVAEYGEKTVVLMQVGSFFEVYGMAGGQTTGQYGSLIADICRIGGLKMAEKNDTHNGMGVLMAGFGEYNLEKYLKLYTEAGLNCVVFVQEDDMLKPNGKKRVFHSIYSAGTFIPIDDTAAATTTTNNMMCIWVKTYKNLREGVKYICGFAVVNSLTGKSYIYEYTAPHLLSPTSFDDLERAVSSFSPSEVVFIKNDPHNAEAEQIIQYSGLSAVTKNIHRVNAETNEKALRCEKAVYINSVLAFYYGEETYQICGEFSMYEFATQCFCFLLNFIQEHNPNWVRKIALPLFTNNSDRMILANHTLKQLNIIGSGGGAAAAAGSHRLSSVMAFLNKTATPMGNRLFQYQLQNPVFNKDWLNAEYAAIGHYLRQSPTKHSAIKKELNEIKDIEKMGRQILHQRIYPASLFQLHRSVHSFQSCLPLFDDEIMLPYLGIENAAKHQAENKRFLAFIESHLDLPLCEDLQTMTSTTPFIKAEVCSTLNNYYQSWQQNRDILEQFCKECNKLFETANPHCEYIKIHETAKSGCSLQITQTRGLVFKDILKKRANETLTLAATATTNTKHSAITLSDIRVAHSSRSDKTDTIEHHILTEACRQMNILEEKRETQMTILYKKFLQQIETDWLPFIVNRAEMIARLDCLQSKAAIAYENQYCCPVIAENIGDDVEGGRETGIGGGKGDCVSPHSPHKQSAITKAIGLRHPLIEHLQKNEIYVPNDIEIGVDGCRGMLLYGTNAVGKTSMIKAVGIALIMAQSGMYVPCREFHYVPYTAVYSRILGNDDIFKGLSTFVVEMCELRLILKMADSRSLVLGDELCSGTETESALSIFTAGLLDLHEKRSSFIFATHFHELQRFEDEMKLIEGQVKMKHLSVYYDASIGGLVYDRKLKDGSGDAIYGLEVAKSLHMPPAFIERAYEIRQKYFITGAAATAPLSNKQTAYNADKIRESVCEICKSRKGEEIHHLEPQKKANQRGWIVSDTASFNKNHPANLITICQKCHDTIHADNGSNDDGNDCISAISNITMTTTATLKHSAVKKKKTTSVLKKYVL